MSRKLSVREMSAGGYKYLRYLLKGGLLNLNLEVTKRCNARCDFCDYWKEEAPPELEDYVPLVRRLDPLSVSLTGGEPFLRNDLSEVIASLRKSFNFLFISLITNGSLLTLQRGLNVWSSGLDELSISLDYPDERHDRERGIPNLAERIFSVAPQLKAAGVNLCFNVVIKRENYTVVPEIVQRSAEMGIKVSLSAYNGRRVGNERHAVPEGELPSLRNTVETLKRMKRDLGNVTTGDYYLDRVPGYFATRFVPGCTAGRNWVQATPDGMIKRCSDQAAVGHFSSWRQGLFEPTGCGSCWYSCRGAAQEPWSLKRFLEMAADAFQ
jgi:MoaA/NifB/PqqE/SkfB family radical SAM enzyme